MIWFLRTLSSEMRMRGKYRVSWNFSVVETLTALAVEEDGFIAENTADEIVHCRLFEFTTVLLAIAVESRRTFNLLSQKIADVYNKQEFESVYQSIRPHRAYVQGYIDI